jgi:hypothetical protein
MARQVLDVFLSSTSKDMREHRSTVTDVLSRMGQFVVRMETFGARPNKPLATCQEEVEACDALIVLVGHRYGWVPSPADGGDGRRSITWYEVTWALDAGLPVYAFLADPDAAWSGPREQDDLVTATTQAQSVAVWRAVRELQEFRTFLDTRVTRELFRSPDHLAGLVATGLFPWLLENAGPVRSSTSADRAPASAIPPDRPPQPSRPRDDPLPEQLYWQEQVHVRSARVLVGERPPVRVATVAGRPQTTHPALRKVEITSVSLHSAPTPPPPDDYTTALAALIAGDSDDGFHGVAPGTPLLAISVLDEDLDATNATIAAGVDSAVLGGARVICLALGTTEHSDVVDDAIADAVRAGVVVVAPAGNGGDETPRYPAASPGVLAVGAVDHQWQLMPWTSHGPWVPVMAPGYEMSLPVGEHGYAPWQGTSWSCAIVAGAAALLLQADPELTPARITDVLTTTGQPVGEPYGRAHGAGLDVYAAASEVVGGPGTWTDRQ